MTMCQVQENDIYKLNINETNISSSRKLCAKCSKAAIIVVGTNGTFCEECFERYITHKFRASMGKNPIVRHGDKVLVAFSGGMNSAGLLWLIKSGLSVGAIRKLKFEPGVIFIDETALMENDQEFLVKEVKTIMASTGFLYHVVKLEDVFHYLTNKPCKNDCKDEVASDKLGQVFQAAKTLTAKNELLYRLRCTLLSFKAKELGYDHVFLGETSTRVAINMMSNVALGRGVHVSQDAGFSDGNRCFPHGADLLRPIRDITAKEMAMYAQLHGVPTVTLANLYTGLQPMSSIQQLTENFILGLVSGYPSTEMTVYRTSNKLQSSGFDYQTNSNLKKCNICQGLLDTHIREDQASALMDTLLSEKISSGNLQDAVNDMSFNSLKDYSEGLCYACMKMDKEFKNPLLSMCSGQS